MDISQSEQFRFEKLKELEKERFELEYGRILKQGFFGLGGFLIVLIQLLFGIRDLSRDERFVLIGIMISVVLAIVFLYVKYEKEKIEYLSRLKSLYIKFLKRDV